MRQVLGVWWRNPLNDLLFVYPPYKLRAGLKTYAINSSCYKEDK